MLFWLEDVEISMGYDILPSIAIYLRSYWVIDLGQMTLDLEKEARVVKLKINSKKNQSIARHRNPPIRIN